jgi:hypothetical protein
VNELAMNLTAERVDHGYLQFLVVSQAAVADMLCKLFAVFDCLGVAREFNSRIGTPSFMSKKNVCMAISPCWYGPPTKPHR